MRKFINNKNLVSLSYKKQDLYKLYNQITSKKALTAFQVKFYEVQALRNYYQLSAKLINQNIESRIDVILVRMNLVVSIKEARQKLSSGIVSINDKIVKSYNYEVKPGDLIKIGGKIEEPCKIAGYILNVPDNMEVNFKLRLGTVIRKAGDNEVF